MYFRGVINFWRDFCLRYFVFEVFECLINDGRKRPNDDDLNHRRNVFNDRWSVVEVDVNEHKVFGTDVDRSIVSKHGVVLTGWRSFFGRWWWIKCWSNFVPEWDELIILVDELDLGNEHDGSSDRNGYGSVFVLELFTSGSVLTYLFGTIITRSSFSIDVPISKV